jgi:hypothetical protein
MSFSKMVDFNPEENMQSLDDETKQLIKEAVKKTYSKFMPNSKSLEYLFEKFKELIEPNFEVSCGKCRTRVINFFHQRSKNW